MNYLFLHTGKDVDGRALPEGYQLCVFTPSLKAPFLSLQDRTGHAKEFHNFIVELRWAIASKFRYKIYYVVHNGEIVHTSYCERKCFKFPFMKKGDVHIGPCHTSDQHRGMNIYPAVLSKICKVEPRHKFMIVEQTNLSSTNGVLKAGFQRIGPLERTKYLHVYKVQGEFSNE